MKGLLVAATVLGGLLVTTSAFSNSPPPENRYPSAFALKVDKAPIIDGVLDEECWGRASEAGSFVPYMDESEMAETQTSFKVVYDDERLYFGIKGQEPNASGLALNEIPHDVWPAVNSVEIFLDTKCDRHTFYRLSANLLGSRYDAYGWDVNWNPDWNAAVKMDKDSWSMEIGIRFSDFGISTPEKGSVWGLNIFRNGELVYQNSSSWAATIYEKTFEIPAKFGSLIFGNALDWWNKESTDLRKESERLHLILSQLEPERKKLEQELKTADDMMQEMSLQKKNLPSEEIKDFLPLYYRMQSLRLREKYQTMAEEMEAVSALQGAEKVKANF